MKSTPVGRWPPTVSRVTPPDASRGTRPCTSDTDRAQVAEGHVVEQDPVGAGSRAASRDLVERVALDLDRQARPPGSRDGGRQVGREQQVVVLDEHRVVEAHPVVRATTTAHGPLLRDPQPGRRLAGVEDDRAGARDGVHVPARERRDAGQPAQQVERQPLTGEHGTGGALEAGDDAGVTPVAVCRDGSRTQVGVQRLEHLADAARARTRPRAP